MLPQTERTEYVRQCKQKYGVFFGSGTHGGEQTEFSELSRAAELVRKGGAEAVLMRGGVPDSAANALIAAGRALNGLEIICEDGSRLLLSHKNYEKLVLFDKGVRDIKGNWYLFENDLLMSKEKDESVSYLIHNEEMFIYRNQTYIKKIKLKRYRFRDFYLMILKDLVYE